MPVLSSSCTAVTGQTWMQGACSHCWQGMGTNTERCSGQSLPLSVRWTRSQVRPRFSAASTGGTETLFSTAHATMQAPQPVHLSRSMTIA